MVGEAEASYARFDTSGFSGAGHGMGMRSCAPAVHVGNRGLVAVANRCHIHRPFSHFGSVEPIRLAKTLKDTGK